MRWKASAVARIASHRSAISTRASPRPTQAEEHHGPEHVQHELGRVDPEGAMDLPVPVEPLDPGPYRLVIRVRDLLAGTEAEGTVAFEITEGTQFP